MGTNRKYDKMLIYFNTIINYTLWKIRNEIKFEFENFSTEKVVSKIMRSIRPGKNIEPKLIGSKRIPFLKDLCSSFMLESRKYLPIDNG